MQVLRNSWYMIAWAAYVDAGATLTRVVADEPIVVHCEHPGAYTAQGAGQRPVAVTLKHRILWVWLGEADRADPAAIPDFSAFDDMKDTAFFCGILPTQAHYELLSDNILDLSHADFLHPATLGGGACTRSAPALEREGNVVIMTWEAPNDVALPVFDMLMPQPGRPAHLRLQVRWYPASAMMLRVQVAPAGEPLDKWFDVHAAHIMTPEHETSTHYFYGARRNYREDDADFNAMQAQIIRGAFAHEDKPMIEAQQISMGQSDLSSLKPVLLPTDAGAVQARRMLARLIQQEAQAA